MRQRKRCAELAMGASGVPQGGGICSRATAAAARFPRMSTLPLLVQLLNAVVTTTVAPTTSQAVSRGRG